MELILAFILSWVSTISGVALGGFLVFRTKRDSYDGLFSSAPQGSSFNLEDDIGQAGAFESSAKIPKPVEVRNDLFVDQFADVLAKKAV